MLGKCLLIVLLSTLAYSKISIKMKPTADGIDSSLDYLGEEISDITATDRELFRIDDESLKVASEKFMGKRCSSVYINGNTPWGDVYNKYGWDIVRKTVKPVQAKVNGVDSKPVAVGTAEYVNNHNSIDVTYSTSVTQEVSETSSHTWSHGGEVGFEQAITYEIDFGVGKAGGSTTFSYSADWGEDVTKERSVSVGTTSSVLVVVPPGGKVLAQLIATRGTANFELRYVTRLNGKVFCNYDQGYNGHHFYALPLRELQEVGGLPMDQESIETIKVGFYTNVRLEVSNGTGRI